MTLQLLDMVTTNEMEWSQNELFRHLVLQLPNIGALTILTVSLGIFRDNSRIIIHLFNRPCGCVMITKICRHHKGILFRNTQTCLFNTFKDPRDNSANP